MASITPALTAATSGFVPPGSFYSGPISGASNTLTDGSVKVLAGFKLRVYYFSSVGDGDLWDSDSTTPPPPGTVRAFWSGDAHAADPANFVVLSSTTDAQGFQIQAETGGATSNGWVLTVSTG